MIILQNPIVKNAQIQAIGMLLIGISVLYGIMIYFIPGFITDDFYIFYLIDQHPSNLIITDPSEKFYLFYRPLSYFYFWLLYTMFGNNPIPMKIVGVLLLAVNIIVAARLMVIVGQYYRISMKSFIIVGMLLFIALHPDTLQSVLWISNSNELLMTFFYLMSVYFVAGIAIGKISSGYSSILITVALYTASILSKQQSLHFPLLIALLLVLEHKRLDKEKKMALWIIVIFSSVIMTASVFMNTTLYLSRDSADNIIAVLWKKPFAIAGILTYIIFPLFGLDLYAYFIINKNIAIIIGFLLSVFVIAYLQSNKTYIKPFVVIVVIVSITLFPRIFLPAADRINLLQIFLIGIAFTIGASKISGIKKSFVTMFTIISVIAGIRSIVDWIEEIHYANVLNFKLHEYITINHTDQIILAYMHPMSTTKHSLYYTSMSKFGESTSLKYTGVIVRNILQQFKHPASVSASVVDNGIQIKTQNTFEEIFIDRTIGHPIVLDSVVGYRGLSSLRYAINRGDTINYSKIIYFNSSEWIELKLP